MIQFISVRSDSNELEYVKTELRKVSAGSDTKHAVHTYKYVKSETKLNQTIDLTDEQVQKMIDIQNTLK